MNTIYGVGRDTDELIVLGSVTKNGNHANLTFQVGALSRFETELRPYALLSHGRLQQWPGVTQEIVESSVETKIWANPCGVRKNRRPVVWTGWPMVWGALLLPAVALPKLSGYELKQDGFLAVYRPVECAAWGTGSAA